MNIKKICAGIIALSLLQVADVRAQGDLFGGNELGYEFFGTWASRDRKNLDDDQLGLGAGVNYFFTRNIGVEAETYLEDFDWPDHLDLSAVARFPLSSLSIDPYVYAGFGRQWRDNIQWTGHIGAGAEYRWSGRTGVFFDIREVFADKDFTLLRLGVRFGF